MSGARRVTKVELRSGWEGVALWLVSFQVKNTVTPMLQLQRAIQPVGSPWSTSTCWEKSLRAYATMMLTGLPVTLYQRCAPSSPSESDHWCDTLQHQILSFSQFAGATLRCACLVLALWKLCVGDVGLLLVQGTTFSWKVHREWCTQRLHDTRRRPLVFFFSPGSFLRLQVSHCCPTAPESKMTKSNEENPKRKVLPWFLDQQFFSAMTSKIQRELQ